MSTLSEGDEIERRFYQLKAQEWACEQEEAKRRIITALGMDVREHCARIAESTSPQDWTPEGMRKAIAEAIRNGGH